MGCREEDLPFNLRNLFVEVQLTAYLVGLGPRRLAFLLPFVSGDLLAVHKLVGSHTDIELGVIAVLSPPIG